MMEEIGHSHHRSQSSASCTAHQQERTPRVSGMPSRDVCAGSHGATLARLLSWRPAAPVLQTPAPKGRANASYFDPALTA